MSEAPERIRVWPDYNDHFSPARHDWTGGIWDDTDDASGIEYIRADLSQAAVEALEAKLAKAVEALEPFATTLERYSGFSEYALFGIWEDVNGAAGRKLNILRRQNFDDARATLAELTGGKNE